MKHGEDQTPAFIHHIDHRTIKIYNSTYERNSVYEFNRVFNHDSNRADIYEEIRPLIVKVMDGYNACIMAYGQTGSGKTYTMVQNNYYQ